MLKLDHNPITGSTYYLEENPYVGVTKEDLNNAIKEVFKDHKDPTIGMSLRSKQNFNKAMKSQVKKFKQKD